MHTIEASCKFCSKTYTDNYNENDIFYRTYEAFKWNRLLIKVYQHTQAEHGCDLCLTPFQVKAELARLTIRGILRDLPLIPIRLIARLLTLISILLDWIIDKLDKISYL